MTQDPVADFLEKARVEPQKLTVSELLGIWGYRVRTYDSVYAVRRALKDAGLGSEPEFGTGGHQSVVRVGAGLGTDPEAIGAGGDPGDQPLRLPLNPIRVRDLPSANQQVLSVTPENTLAQAMSLMARKNYSQLAVLSGDRPPVRAVSWQSIAHAQFRMEDAELKDAWINPAPVVHPDGELLHEIGLHEKNGPIEKHGFVLVQDADDRICGIITTADIAFQFRNLTTPFFQLGEIERRLRQCIDLVFSDTELCVATGNNKLTSASDMMFGEYAKLLRDDARWIRMGWRGDHVDFMDQLNRARVVRNSIMHFGEQLTTAEQLELEMCLNYMRTVDRRP